SYSLSEIWLGETLTLILMLGALSLPRSEFGAPGFSKDRSLMYCARILSVGDVPFPFAAPSVPAPAFVSLAISRIPLCRSACGSWFQNRALANMQGPG